MTTYRKAVRITPILLLVVFIFAASQPVRAYSHKNTLVTHQHHLENLAVNLIPDWHTATFHIKSPLIGTTWSIFLKESASQRLVSDALDVSLNELSYIFSTKTINAP